jgi:hypothetical protein
MRRRSPRTKRPKAERALLATLLVLLGYAGPARAGEERKPRVRIEFGIDAYQRAIYRPSFEFVSAAPLLGGTTVLFDLAYLQRANGQLEGPVDFRLNGGLEKRLAKAVSVRASLAHFCRHVTSRSNPYILNYNEAVGRVAWTPGAFRLGLGFGLYLGGSPGLSRIVVLDFDIARLILQELSFESELKWTDFSEIYHEAGLAFALGRGIDLVLRSSRTYGLPTETFIGVRLASDGAAQSFVDRFDLTFGLAPSHDDYKLVGEGGFRLIFLRAAERRLLVDVEFDTPILNGSRFLGQFWPDRMIYNIGAQYEITGRGFVAAWYARYTLDMPSDRAVPFAGRLGTGLIVRNRPDFAALDAPLRVEAFAGIDFGRALDFGIRAGANTVAGKPFDVGAELDWRRTGGSPAYELKAFAAMGKEISIRPFVGVRRLGLYSPDPPADEPVRKEWMFGVSFLKWY